MYHGMTLNGTEDNIMVIFFRILRGPRMNRALVLLFAFVMMVTCLPTGDNVPPGDAPPSRGRIIFQDEFDFFDPNKWQHLVTAWRGGNDEFQYYADRGENR